MRPFGQGFPFPAQERRIIFSSFFIPNYHIEIWVNTYAPGVQKKKCIKKAIDIDNHRTDCAIAKSARAGVAIAKSALAVIN
jgi:hypothetical protein